MKKLLYIFCITALLFTACRYEEPSASVQKPEYRLTGYWLLQDTKLNGNSVDTSIYDANIPQMNYYAFYHYGPFAVTSIINNALVESKTGNWQLVDKDRNLEMFFVLYNKTYRYKAQIIKLSNKELKYRYTDPQGDVWTLHFFKRS